MSRRGELLIAIAKQIARPRWYSRNCARSFFPLCPPSSFPSSSISVSPQVLRNGLFFLHRQFLYEPRQNILPAPANAFSTYKSLDDAGPCTRSRPCSHHTKPCTIIGLWLTCKSRVPHTRRVVLTGGKRRRERKEERERERTDIGSGRREKLAFLEGCERCDVI